jgi:hypothetical protein
MKFLFILFLYCGDLMAFEVLEPSIECTVVKVLNQRDIGQLNKFPNLHAVINNKPATSKLVISGIEFKNIDPVTILKTENYERILIKVEQSELILELTGKPISRNGKLKFGPIELGKITCH